MGTQNETHDEQARRSYWTEQMEAAHAFIMSAQDYPVEECGEVMAFLPDAVQEAEVEVVFSTTKVGKGHQRQFYLREGLIDDFIAVARHMNRRGWMLKVEDAYRTSVIQTELGKDEKTFDVVLKRVIWEDGGVVPSPEKMFRRLTALIATSPKIGTHMSGSAVDISVLRRDDGSEVDRGGPYIELSELTPMHSPFISEEARENRAAITAMMARYSFVAYPYEFWHYSKGDAYDEYLAGAGRAARYGAVDMDPTTGQTTAIPSPKEPLHTFADIQAEIEKALARRT